LAGAAALGFVDLPRVTINAQVISIQDAGGRLVGSVADWLASDDPLDVAAREYLHARQEAVQSGPKPNAKPWEAAARTKKREEANQRAIAARTRGKVLLDERGILAKARADGLRVLE
jgi:hypothetical protein